MVYFVTLLFAPARILRESIKVLQATRTITEYRHVFVDQHYPLNREQNIAELRQIAAEIGAEVLDPGKNLGLHEGFNWTMRTLGMKQGDMMICFDADANPLTVGWDQALVDVIQHDDRRKIAWASLMNDQSEADIRTKGFSERKVWGHEVMVMKQATMNCLCAFDIGWLLSTGGLREHCAFYGHLEAEMFSRLGDRQWVFLKGFRENQEIYFTHDEDYRVYKWVHAHLQTWKGDFASWLAAGKPNAEAVKHLR